MTDRLTDEWTPSLKEAFGERGERGRNGELLVIKFLESTGHEVVDHESDHQSQVRGIDISFKKPHWNRMYTGDCKANLRNDGSFYLEYHVWKNSKRRPGWLFTCKADRVFHVNVAKQWLCYYDLNQLKQRIADYNFATPQDGLMLIKYDDSRFKDLIRSMHYYGK
jgi:hypothetical protein